MCFVCSVAQSGQIHPIPSALGGVFELDGKSWLVASGWAPTKITMAQFGTLDLSLLTCYASYSTLILWMLKMFVCWDGEERPYSNDGKVKRNENGEQSRVKHKSRESRCCSGELVHAAFSLFPLPSSGEHFSENVPVQFDFRGIQTAFAPQNSLFTRLYFTIKVCFPTLHQST